MMSKRVEQRKALEEARSSRRGRGNVTLIGPWRGSVCHRCGHAALDGVISMGPGITYHARIARQRQKGTPECRSPGCGCPVAIIDREMAQREREDALVAAALGAVVA